MRAESRSRALERMPGCIVVLCQAYFAEDGRMEKEQQRALTAVHNVALGFVAQGVGVKWMSGATTQNYELWELVGLDPNEEVVVGLLWYGWPVTGGTKPIRDATSPVDKLSRLA